MTGSIAFLDASQANVSGHMADEALVEEEEISLTIIEAALELEDEGQPQPGPQGPAASIEPPEGGASADQARRPPARPLLPSRVCSLPPAARVVCTHTTPLCAGGPLHLQRVGTGRDTLPFLPWRPPNPTSCTRACSAASPADCTCSAARRHFPFESPYFGALKCRAASASFHGPPSIVRNLR